MGKATVPIKNEVNNLNVLLAFKNSYGTPDGKAVIDYILKITELTKDPFTNSGHTAHSLGKQNIGRHIIDILVEAGVNVDASILSTKKFNVIESIRNKINLQLKDKK